MNKLLLSLALLFILGSLSETKAEGFGVGVGLGFADSSGGYGLFDGGWDFMLGYEMYETDDLNFGMDLHVIRGWTTKNDVDKERALGVVESTIMAYNSEAIYMTMRPENWWLQLKAGVVHADYYTVDNDENTYGIAMGVGLVTPSDIIQVHLLDYARYQVGSKSFSIYSISAVIFLAPGIF